MLTIAVFRTSIFSISKHRVKIFGLHILREFHVELFMVDQRGDDLDLD